MCTFQAFACVSFVKISLIQGSPMAKPQIRRWGVYPTTIGQGRGAAASGECGPESVQERAPEVSGIEAEAQGGDRTCPSHTAGAGRS